ncbi:type I polyketide synthase [Nocardia sp. BMG51109]|uniref:type I polyketide synthase n=1 Tax=Nocardia sp. BMG51109 TaxID=1056816 RepID=UPI0004AED382|nr:type I polyketide synthase [Nocardia sp. BMG51109]
MQLPHPPLVFSADSPDGLTAAAGRLCARVEALPDEHVWELACAQLGQRHSSHRGAVLAADRAGFVAGLQALANGRTTRNTVRGTADIARAPVFVFPGQSPLWPGMAGELLHAVPAFRTLLEGYAQALRPHLGWDVIAALADDGGRDRLEHIQPIQFAVSLALSDLWRRYGLRPAAVVGHSQGELAAAHASGGVGRDDAARLITLHSSALARIEGRGAMLSVSAPLDRIEPVLADRAGQLAVSAVNGPADLTVSGAPEAIAKLRDDLTDRNIWAWQLPGVRVAGHSEQVDSLERLVLDDASAITPLSPHTALYSAVSASRVGRGDLTPDYWFRNLRRPVHFESAVRSLLDDGHRLFVEMSTHPALLTPLRATMDSAGTSGAVVGSLDRRRTDVEGLLLALTTAFVNGATIDWDTVRADLCAPRPSAAPRHPLLSQELALPHVDEWLFGGRLSPAAHPWLRDHRVRQRTLLPGTAILDLIGYAGERVGCRRIGELVLEAPLDLSATDEPTIQVVVSAADDDGHRPVALYSRPSADAGSASWTRHASGRLAPGLPGTTPPAPWPPTDARPVDVGGLYARLSGDGYHYGAAFRGVSAMWLSDDSVYAEISLPEFAGRAHPAALDAVLHAWLYHTRTADRPLLPFIWRNVSLHRPRGTRMRVRITPGRADDQLTISAFDEHGAPVLQADSLGLRPAPAPVHCLVWEHCDPQPEGRTLGARVMVAGRPESVDRSCEALEFTDLAGLRQALPTDPGTEPPVAVLGCASGSTAVDANADADAAISLADNGSRELREWCSQSAPTLAVVTRGAVTVRPEDSISDPAAASIWGSVAAAQQEWPGRVVVIDTDAPATTAQLTAALASGENRLALRKGTFHRPRRAASEDTLTLPHPAEWRLGTTRPGSADRLELLEDTTSARPLEPHEVRVRVRAASLNFRDVLVALGRYPDPAADLGCDGAGIVTDVGAGCTDLAPGTPVMGIFGAYSATAVADRNMLVAIPRHWSMAEAAAAPLAYATASHGLIGTAGLRAGESVLIHAASTGVGTAAVHIARRAGAEVFATAHPAKWGVLRDIGLDPDHIADSRSTAFEDRFRRTTAGAGMDVVLGGVVGEVAEASLRLLSAGGRYVDLSWVDPDTGNQVRARYPGIRYEPINILEIDATRIRTILERLRADADAGHLPPPRLRAWDVRYAKYAFRSMSGGRHTGKLVLTVPRRPGRGTTVLVVGEAERPVGEVAAHLAEKYGVHVVTADPASAETVFAEHPCTGVVALSPGAAGAVSLHHLTARADLAQFVLLVPRSESGAASDGGENSAETAFLGALVRHRRASGLAGCAVRGVDVRDVPQVLDCLDEAFVRAEPVLEAGAVSAETAPRRKARRHETREHPALDQHSPTELRERLHELLSRESIALLGHGLTSTTTSFQQLGFDSLTAVALADRIADATGLPLPTTVLFDHPTPAELVRWLCDRIEPGSAEVPVDETPAAVAQDRVGEPIAIVGMACRFPGDIDSAEDLWQLIAAETDALDPFPTDRGWDRDRLHDPDPDRPGASAAHRGGFLTDAAGFDPALFGISHREATAMDPQQRLLLEVGWAAIEDAGLAPTSLRGSDTGVFIGCYAQEYGPRLPQAHSDSAGHLLTGTTTSVASGRIAYTLGLHGPAITFDTACSSALVAIHSACEAVRNGTCSLAIAGGATVMSGPGLFTEFTKQHGLAPDGRCKPFAAAADGTGWGEGGGLLVLERLSEAERRGHRVLAVIAGSAVNSDGASNGLTAPNGPAQERVIRRALTAAGLTPDAVDAVEAHGTGTALGDPIEANGLLAAYGTHHTPERPLYLGSVKSNIGHTQAAAGVAGVIKMVMALRHGVLPATLHIDAPTPHVDWSSGTIRLLTEALPWPENGHPRTAAVSSFGISGTNAHLILRQPAPPGSEPAAATDESDDRAPVLLFPLSGHTPQALAGNAARLRRHLEAHPEIAPADLARTLATARAQHGHRATVTLAESGNACETIVSALRSLGDGGTHPNLVTAEKPCAEPGDLVFVCGGQGAQYPGMGAGLYRLFPRYRDAFDETCAALDPHLDSAQPLRDIIFADPDSPAAALLDRTEFTQPALFAVQVALHALLTSLGLTPDVVMGHSIGELTAVHLAGVWSLDDAAEIVAARGRFMQSCPGHGRMLAVNAAEDELAPLLRDVDGISVAAVNGPGDTVLSGDADALARVRERLDAQHRTSTFLQVGHAFHSAHMDAALQPFADVAAGATYHGPQVAVQSCLTAGPATADQLSDPGYWARQLRHTVRFHEAVTYLVRHGEHTFLELSPHAALTAALTRTLTDTTGSAALSTLRRNRPDGAAVATALAALHHRGHSPDWVRLTPGARSIPLPTYAFQHRRFWLSPGRPAAPGPDHPLFDTATELADDKGWVFTGRVSLHTHPWLADHTIAGTALFPGAAVAELMLSTGQHIGCPHITELVLHQPLSLRDTDDGVDMRVQVGDRDAAGPRPITVHSRPHHPGGPAQTAPWTQHATGSVAPVAEHGAAGATRPPDLARPIDVTDLYSVLAERGYGYGPAFQGVRAARIDDTGPEPTVYTDVVLPEDVDSAGYGIHPALLDAALHSLLVPAVGDDHEHIRIPFVFKGITLHAVRSTRLHVAATRTGPDTVTVHAADPLGAPVLTIEAVTLRPLPDPAPAAAVPTMLELTWIPTADAAPDITECDTTGWAVLTSEPGRLPAALRGLRTCADLSALLDNDRLPAAVIWYPAHDRDEVPAAVRATTDEALTLLRQWVTHPGTATVPLLVCTSHAVATSPHDPAPNLAHAAVWGLTRSTQSEHPDHSITLLDIAIDTAPNILAAVLDRPDPRENQLAARHGTLHRPRLTHSPALAPPETRGGSWRLGVRDTGDLNTVAYVPTEPAALRPGEIRIAVRAAGLNFRDVVGALGLVETAGFGREAAGVVVETGPGVGDFAIGDAVTGFLDDAFAPTAAADARAVVPMPPNWSFTEAAAVPIVFTTAHAALVALAELRPGQRVLVHAGTGGVGQAAIQLARHRGAEVFATASPPKQHLLRAMGIPADHIASSRTLGFRTAFLEATGGNGMDVVLDCLAGEFVDASLDLLPHGGYFLEIGKTDIRDPETVAGAHPGVRYHALDLTDFGPDRIADSLAALVSLFEQGALAPIPVTNYAIPRARQALRDMAAARHTGKIVLTPPRALDPEGTVLITGGTGALAALIAEHLVVDHGVRRLLLVSRRGPAAPGAGELHRRLTALGAEVTLAACDVADPSAAAGLLDAVDPRHPLTAVVHTAAVADDAPVTALRPDRLRAVLAGKLDGAWHLHRLTRHLDLAAFVLFSSAAGILGNPGQANYAAANAALDALAEYRRRRGLPAVSIVWGPWDIGLASRLGERERQRIAATGLIPIADELGTALFDRALTDGHPVVVAAPLRSGARTDGDLPPVLSALVTARRTAAGPSGRGTELSGLTAEQRLRHLLDAVRSATATVLGHPDTATTGVDDTFKDLGIDSLTAIELRNALARSTHLDLPPTLVFDHPTPGELARYLDTLLAPSNTETSTAAPTPAAADDDPVVVVGMSCRFPGGIGSPQALWDLVSDGVDAIGAFPDDRGWNLEELFDPDPDVVGTTYTRHGGFLTDADGFDNELFEISPREATAMDPQQRVLLETCWAALETACLDPKSLHGSSTGVFIGACAQQDQAALPATAEGYALTGNATSVASGRIAYTLGLHGPAITVDTACSSSLVATHLASESLRRGECDLAIAGGVTIMAGPFIFTEFARQRGLAADGRCKPFAAAADGTGWGEGAGIVVLERMSDAQRNRHPILAVVAGSAINQDGASNGLTAPNGPAQQRVIRRALASGGLTADRVDVVEAHGTGTTLGDPIEAGALLATYGRAHTPDTPLYLGSVKSNIGHTQAAAGAAGIIKMIQAIRHGVLPKTLHAEAPSPHVDWDGTIALLTDSTPWPDNGHPRTAAVSSFGISGTNAHLILQQHSAPTGFDEAPRTAAPALLFPVSAADPAALAAQAARLREHLDDHPDLDPADLAYSLATTRTHHGHRATVVGSATTGEDIRTTLARALTAAETGQPDANLFRDNPSASQPSGLVFVLPGQGAQHPGMGRTLYHHYAAYRDALDRACLALSPHLDLPDGTGLREIIHADPDTAEAALLDRTDIVQPALFAVGVALAALLESVGVTPDIVIGHSQGEITAACVAGALSLEDAATVMARRSRLIARHLAGTGTMASLGCGADTAETLLRPWRERIAVAAVNGPANVTVAGAVDAVEELVHTCGRQGIRARGVRVDYASHSAGVEAVRERLAAELGGLAPRPSRVAFHSTVAGQPHAVALDTSALTGEYWYHNLRRTVHFNDTVTALLGTGPHTFLELSPHPVLTPAIEESVNAAREDDPSGASAASAAVATLNRDRDDSVAFAAVLARLHNRGHRLDWEALQPGRRIPLPTYAFHRRRYRRAAPATVAARADGGPAGDPATDSAPPAVRRMAELAPSDRRAFVVDLVRRTAGLALGRGDGADVGIDASLIEQGLTSVKGTELRGELTGVTGVAIPTGLLMSSVATVEQIADYILTRLTADGPATDDESPTGLVSLLRRALENGLAEQGLQTVDAAALLRTQLEQTDEYHWTKLLQLSPGRDGAELPPTRDRAELPPTRDRAELPPGRNGAQLSPRGDGPAIVCFPSLLPHSGPLEYSALAKSLPHRNLFALAQPGYLPQEKLPGTLAALVSGHLAEIRRELPDRPLILLGYSTGGWVAHAVAAELLARRRPPAGLVLIDTYGPPDLDNSLLRTLIHRAITAHEDMVTDTSITAMSNYRRIFSTFKPRPLDIPGLLLHAGHHRIDETINFPQHGRNRWTRRPNTTTIPVPANHLTILTDETDHAAAEIDRWLSEHRESHP